ncbi:MAG: hypothetical protein C4339_06175 [Nitrososphaerota archaeon]
MQRTAIAAIALAIIAGAASYAYLSLQQGAPPGPGGVTGAPSGTLAILVTDPPQVPEGVTAIYINYSSMAVHLAQAGNQSGWIEVNARGTLDLMKLVNVTTTVASLNLTGKFNALLFNISSALVTYNGKNYTCFVPSGKLTVPIIGGVEVAVGQAKAIVLDLQPAVLNMGTSDAPIFVLRPAAKAFTVPDGEVSREMLKPGFMLDLRGKAWWSRLRQQYTSRIGITSASLSNDSLSVTVKSDSNETVLLKLLIISPFVPSPPARPLPSFFGSEVFIIQENGTLTPIQFSCPPIGFQRLERCLQVPGGMKELRQLLEGGYALPAHGTATFSYSGAILLGFGIQGCRLEKVGEHQYRLVCDIRGLSVVPGQQYLITIIGDKAVAGYVVKAR